MSLTQRSRCATTLGFGAQPLRGWIGLLIILTASSVSQARYNGSIAGRISDVHNAAVVGAEVRLLARAGSQFTAVTDDNGAYSFTNLASGDYVLEVKAKGFAGFTSKELRVTRGDSLTNDVRLSVETVNENVVVTAGGTAQRIDETSKAVSTLDEQNIEARRELTLPESLRGIPGVRVQQQGSFGALTTVRLRGLRNFETAILLDGLRVRDASDI